MAAVDVTTEVSRLRLDQIVENPANPRRDARADEQMVASVRSLGIIQPLVVRPVGTDRWELLAGHRRLDAARKAKLDEVPVTVRHANDDQALAVMIVENLARHDLKPLEEAGGIMHLVNLGNTQRAVAEMLGVSQSHVSKRLALLKLPERAQEAVDSGGITLEKATELASKVDPAKISELWAKKAGPKDWEIDSAIRDAEWARARAAALTEAEKAGIPVVDGRPGWNRAHPPVNLGYLGLDQEAVEAHASEPCRAVWVDHMGKTVACCTDPARHPEPDDDEGDEEAGESPMRRDDAQAALSDARRERDEALAERDRARDDKSAGRARRQAFAVDILARPIEGTQMTPIIALAAHAVTEVSDIDPAGPLALLGLDPTRDWEQDAAAAHEFAGDKPVNQLRWLHAVALDVCEGLTWAVEPGTEPTVRRYLRHLVTFGYQPAGPFETELLAEQQTIEDALDTDEPSVGTDEVDDDVEPAELAYEQGVDAEEPLEPPAVAVAKKGRKWSVDCSACGHVGINTVEDLARQRVTDHLWEAHDTGIAFEESRREETQS